MKRFALVMCGWLSLGLGIAGAFLPVLPTVPFLLLTATCWARSNERLHAWLLSHPTWGPPLRDWKQHGVIPPRAKLMATAMIALSLTGSFVAADLGWPLRALVVTCCSGSLCFILTRPSSPEPAYASSSSSG